MTMNKIVSLAKQHPPRCLNGFTALPDTRLTERVLHQFWPETYDTVAFELHGPAANRSVLLGHYLNKEWPDGRGRILVSPLIIKWIPSGGEVLLFDGEQHGYNPEYGFGRVHGVSPNPQSHWSLPEGQQDHLFIACFSYHPSDPDHMDTDEVMKGHPQDFFDMFLLAAYSRVEDTILFVTEFECA